MSLSGARNCADPFQQFMGPESDTFCQFLAPETDVMGQFLGPETDTFCQFLAPIVFSRMLANRKRKKQFEHAMDQL